MTLSHLHASTTVDCMLHAPFFIPLSPSPLSLAHSHFLSTRSFCRPPICLSPILPTKPVGQQLLSLSPSLPLATVAHFATLEAQATHKVYFHCLARSLPQLQSIALLQREREKKTAQLHLLYCHLKWAESLMHRGNEWREEERVSETEREEKKAGQCERGQLTWLGSSQLYFTRRRRRRRRKAFWSLSLSLSLAFFQLFLLSHSHSQSVSLLLIFSLCPSFSYSLCSLASTNLFFISFVLLCQCALARERENVNLFPLSLSLSLSLSRSLTEAVCVAPRQG